MIRSALAYLLIIESAFAGLPPTTVKGQSESTKPTTFFLETPYNQATSTASSTRRLETGNQNRLVNPSFEHETVSTGWTITASSSAPGTSIIKEGLKAVSIIPNASTGIVIRQDVPLTAGDKEQVWEASAWVYSDPGVQLCASYFFGGNDVEIQCVDIQQVLGASKFVNQSVFFTLPGGGGASTASIYLKATTTGQPTVIPDDMYIGPARTLTGIVPGETIFSADVSSTGVITNQTGGTWLASCTNTTTPNCTFTTNFFGGITPQCWHSTSTGAFIGASNYTSTTYSGNILNSSGTPITGDRKYYCRRVGSDYDINRGTRAEVVGLVPSETVFTAISSSAGVISGENVDFITTCSISDTSLFSCNWVSGFFGSNSPNCIAGLATDASGTSMTAEVTAISTSTFQVRTLSGGAKSAQPWRISCQRQGDDYTRSRTTYSNVRNFISTPSTNQEVIARAVLSCSASSSIQSQSGSWVSLPGNISSGRCNYTVNAGTFSSDPTCSAVITDVTGTPAILGAISTTSQLSVDCATGSGTACSGFTANVICMGPK